MDYSKFVKNHVGDLLFFVFLVLGLVLLVAAELLRHHEFSKDILRDLGIACVVAAIVGKVYDQHARTRFDIETMSGVMGAIMGDFIRSDIWNAVKDQIIDKALVREPLSISITLQDRPSDELPAGTMVLRVKMDYFARNLKATTRKETIKHRLDFHRSAGAFPRFTSIRVGSDRLSEETLRKINSTGGRFDYPVTLSSRDERGVHVVVDREELVYIPGSYNLVLAGVVKTLKVGLHSIPDGVTAAINLRPHTDSPIALAPHEELTDELEDIVILPGQVIEFIFSERRSVQSPSAGDSAVTRPVSNQG